MDGTILTGARGIRDVWVVLVGSEKAFGYSGSDYPRK